MPFRARMPAESEPVDPRSGETEERGQQRDRGDHHDQHDDRDRDPGGGHHRNAGDRQAEDGDDDGAAGEDDDLTGGLDGTADRLLDRHAACEVLAVPGDEEQGVVDADAEADHAAQLGRPAGDVDQVGDERHRADAEGEAEERDRDREAHGDDRSERHEQDDGGGDQADELAGPGLGLLEREEQVAAHLEPQRRTRSGLRAERLEVLQVVRAQLLEHRIADADERDATVCGHRPTPYRTSDPAASIPAGSLVPRTCGSAAAPAWISASAARSSAESKNVARSSRGVTTSWAVSPA